jgi:hypothetical protein
MSNIREANSLRVLQQGNTVADRTKNSLIASINRDFTKNPSYREVIRNNTETLGVIITDNSSNATAKVDNIRSIIVKPNDVLNVGDVFDYNGHKWITTSAEMFSDIYYKGMITQSNHTLLFYKNKILRTLPCIIQTSGTNYLDIAENRFLSTANGKYLCICPDLGYITKSDMNLRFLIKGSAYKIGGINNLLNGLIVLELVDDKIIADDNLDLGIANWGSNQLNAFPDNNSTTTVTLTPSDTTLMLGRTLELTAHAYVNNVEDFTKYFLFTVTNVDGTNNNYVTSSSVDNKCTITASKSSSIAGKYINVRVEILGSPTIFYERQIKLISL